MKKLRRLFVVVVSSSVVFGYAACSKELAKNSSNEKMNIINKVKVPIQIYTGTLADEVLSLSEMVKVKKTKSVSTKRFSPVSGYNLNLVCATKSEGGKEVSLGCCYDEDRNFSGASLIFTSDSEGSTKSKASPIETKKPKQSKKKQRVR